MRWLKKLNIGFLDLHEEKRRNQSEQSGDCCWSHWALPTVIVIIWLKARICCFSALGRTPERLHTHTHTQTPGAVYDMSNLQEIITLHPNVKKNISMKTLTPNRPAETNSNYPTCPASEAKHSFLRVCILVLSVQPKELSRDRCDPETAFTHQLNWGWQSWLLDIPKPPLCSHFKHPKALQETHLSSRSGWTKKVDQLNPRASEDDSVWSIMGHLATRRDCMTAWCLTQLWDFWIVNSRKHKTSWSC